MTKHKTKVPTFKIIENIKIYKYYNYIYILQK